MNTAIKQLQELIKESGQNISVDGIFGKQTRTAIENMKVPNWVKTAMKEIGTREIHGKKHSDRVLEYHSVSGGYSEDEVPWCGSFVNWVLINSHIIDTVRIPARAKSWLGFGVSSEIPIIGSIAVKSRNGGGHVCFVVGKDKNGNLYCIGGNQSDEVNIRLYPRGSFIDFRVPTHYMNNTLPIYALNVNNNNKEA